MDIPLMLQDNSVASLVRELKGLASLGTDWEMHETQCACVALCYKIQASTSLPLLSICNSTDPDMHNYISDNIYVMLCNLFLNVWGFASVLSDVSVHKT